MSPARILFGSKDAAASCLFCVSYVISTDISFMRAEVMSPNTLTSGVISFVMAESKSRVATLFEEDLNLLIDDKDKK